MVITTVYYQKMYWECHNLIIGALLLECLVNVITSSEYFVSCATCSVVCLLDNNYSSDCEVINDTVRLTCLFPFRLSPTANIVWNIDSTNIICNKTTTDSCECLINSTVFVSSQHVSASTTCTASNNNKMTIQYPYRPSGLSLKFLFV